MRQRIYIDTSVIGGYYDDEFAVPTRQLFGRIADREYDIYFSEVNEEELLFAPDRVKEVKEMIPVDCLRYVEITEEVRELTRCYIAEGALGKASENDAYHIALASAHRVDCLVSWNFRHIVNFDKIRMFNSVNLRHRYPIINIYSPLAFLKL